MVDHVGKVTDIDTISQKIFVTVSMFGRETPVELGNMVLKATTPTLDALKAEIHRNAEQTRVFFAFK